MGAILTTPVVRRLTPLVLTIVIAFAPAALVFCEALCAGHAPVAAPVDQAAHHHHTSPVQDDATTVAVSHHAHHDVFLARVTTGVKVTSHRCTRGDRLPVAAGVSLATLFAPAVLTTALGLSDVPTTAVFSQHTSFRAPPHPSHLITQLRI